MNCVLGRMAFRSTVRAAVVCIMLIVVRLEPCFSQERQIDPQSDFRQQLQSLADLSPSPCPPDAHEKDWHFADSESRLFNQAANIVAEALNAADPSQVAPRERAANALKALERMSTKINVDWPSDNRFHFEILDVSPALVVKMGIREHESFFVYGIPEKDSGKPNRLWQEVGSDDNLFDPPPGVRLNLYPLHRGPSGNARFLAKSLNAGCAGSMGVAYEAYEWNPEGTGNLDEIIKQAGALGLDDKVSGFEWIGKLQTDSPLITLPYCWFSAIDTWDNPSLCAVDTYDLSGDDVKFRSRTYNRPDLLPIAKAIEYAAGRDYPAVLGYCASEEIASTLVREIPPFVFAGDLRVTPTADWKERVELGDGPAYRFDVERRGDRWLVVWFQAE